MYIKRLKKCEHKIFDKHFELGKYHFVKRKLFSEVKSRSKKELTFSCLGFNLLGERTKISSLKKPVALRYLPGSSNILVQSLVPVGH